VSDYKMDLSNHFCIAVLIIHARTHSCTHTHTQFTTSDAKYMFNTRQVMCLHILDTHVLQCLSLLRWHARNYTNSVNNHNFFL